MTANPIPERPAADGTPPGTAPSDQQYPAPAGAAPHRQLLRSSGNRVLGGVCGGLAEYTGTDPLLWRIGFIAFAFMGAGLIVYALLWLLVPAAAPNGSAGGGVSGIQDTLRNGRAPRS